MSEKLFIVLKIFIDPYLRISYKSWLGKHFTNYPWSLGLVVLTLDVWVTRLERGIQTSLPEESVHAENVNVADYTTCFPLQN